MGYYEFYARKVRQRLRGKLAKQYDAKQYINLSKHGLSTEIPTTLYAQQTAVIIAMLLPMKQLKYSKYLERLNSKRLLIYLSKKHGQLAKSYNKQRDLLQVELKLSDAVVLRLSPGKHNALQVAVIKDFGPRFASGAKLLYIGDTAHKRVICETEILAKLEINITEHDKLPDIILYNAKKQWLYMIEAVTSHGPVNPKRHAEIETMLSACPAERIYVTAFMKKIDFRRYAGDIAWETEVWIAESPDHMIHFNGPKFLGPYKSKSVI